MKTTKKTTRRTFVKTTDGEKLELTKTRLSQLPEDFREDFHEDFREAFYDRCYLTFVNLRNAKINNRGLTVTYIDSRLSCYVSFCPQIGQLGCCVFDEKTFNKIMKAAGSKVRFGNIE